MLGLNRKELLAEIAKLEKEWDRLDGHGRDIEQADISIKLGLLRDQLSLIDNDEAQQKLL